MFRHRNIVLRFQRILLTWFIPFLYSLLKTFSSLVLTSKSLIWVEMITLGLFWTENEIFVWIWSKTLSLHFGKSKVPIFVSKCYTTLIFAQNWPYGHRKDCIWIKTKCLNILTQKYCITVPKDSVDFVYSKKFPQIFWLQNLSFRSKWIPSACFGPKMKILFGFEV